MKTRQKSMKKRQLLTWHGLCFADQYGVQVAKNLNEVRDGDGVSCGNLSSGDVVQIGADDLPGDVVYGALTVLGMFFYGARIIHQAH